MPRLHCSILESSCDDTSSFLISTTQPNFLEFFLFLFVFKKFNCSHIKYIKWFNDFSAFQWHRLVSIATYLDKQKFYQSFPVLKAQPILYLAFQALPGDEARTEGTLREILKTPLLIYQ